jgi:hypothetical protein
VQSVAGDRGKKKAKEVAKRRGKRRKLCVLREKEVEDKRKHDEKSINNNKLLERNCYKLFKLVK